MRIKACGALLGIALLAAGCAEEEPEVAEVAVEPAVPAAPVTPAPAAAPAAGGMEMIVNMQPLNDSGVTGQGAVSPGAAGTDTQVSVTLNAGGTGGTTHQGHIHQGTCDSIGNVVHPLQPITLDASGSGTMTATAPLPPSTVMNGQHIIVYHEAGGNPGTPIVCGSIPQHTM